MFSQASGGVCVSRHAPGQGVCVSQHAPGQGVWTGGGGGVDGEGRGGVHPPPPVMVTEADGTHPTGMHTLFIFGNVLKLSR